MSDKTENKLPLFHKIITVMLSDNDSVSESLPGPSCPNAAHISSLCVGVLFYASIQF